MTSKSFLLLNLQILFLLALVLLLTKAASSEPSTTCQTQCGNITIPYPFGIGTPDCFWPGFNVTCDESSTTSGPKLFLGDGTVEVADILLTEGQVRIKSSIASLYCTPEDPVQDSKIIYWSGLERCGPFSFSSSRNTFITISCGAISYVSSFSIYNTSSTSLCASVCLDDSDYDEEECSGVGCCNTNIGLSPYKLTLKLVSIMNQTRISTIGSCTKAFVVDREWYAFNSPQVENFSGDDRVPVVLDWMIGNSRYCKYARNDVATYSVCRSKNSFSYELYDGTGYRCNCSHGFEGNPYVSNGCKDINECEVYSNPCFGGLAGKCLNTIGSYSCNCPQGKHKIHRNDPTSLCIDNKSPSHTGVIISTGMGAGLGLLILFVSTYLFYKRLEQINIKKHRFRCFCRNHGLLLQQLLTSIEDDVERTKIFNLEEVEKATNNFDVTRILGRGGHGTVYKGILSDQRVVAIKRSEIEDQREIEQFINEVAILSQINHRNVVKLFGCCLETEVPLLVYEFISEGTLSDHLHVRGNNNVSSLSFEDRLRIATEVAGALAYLHSSASISIFHRDIKSSNILLDHNYTAKISDFGASRSIPLERTHLTTAVQGTFGYLDPEYYYTGKLSEKSDVYSFGVILVELLTGERAISQSLLRQEKNLAMHFICSLNENKLFNIIDPRAAEEGTKEELEAIAMLAGTCLRLKGEERPTMKKVEEMLNRLDPLMKQKRKSRASEQKNDESECSMTNKWSGSNTSDATRLYSLEKEFMMSLSNPR